MIGKVLSLLAGRRRRHRRRNERRLVAQSGLFDADWYLSRYPDVARSGQDALDHYLIHGAFERRAAGPLFDTQTYLQAHPAVAGADVNALLHYLENRTASAPGFPAELLPAPAGDAGGTGDRAAVSFSLILSGSGQEAVDGTLASLDGRCDGMVEVIVVSAATARPPGRTIARTSRADSLEAAVDLATCDYIVLLDAGDVLAARALQILSDHLSRAPSDIVYSDESRRSPGAGDATPLLKPRWSPDLMTSCNYFGRLTAIRRPIAQAACSVGATGPDWEHVLNRSAASRARTIDRIPHVLCRRGDGAASSEGLRRIEAADPTRLEHRPGSTDDRGSAADGNGDAAYPGAGRPLVSIVVPRNGSGETLRRLVEACLAETDYPEIEIVVPGRRSEIPHETVLPGRFASHPLRIVAIDDGVGYAKTCNLAASAAQGQFLLFLRDDVGIVGRNWLETLVRAALAPDVGIVGPKLLRADGRVQSAGVGVGLHPLASDMFTGAGEDDHGVFGTPDVSRTVTAVAGGCQLIHRAVFELVGGYDEELPAAQAGTLLWVRAGRFGFRTVYVADAALVLREARQPTDDAAGTVLLAGRLRALGFDEDPFLHPDLDARHSQPRRREHWPEFGRIDLRRDIERLSGPQDPAAAVDLFDDASVAGAAGLPWKTVTWPFDRGRLACTSAGGARFLIELLRRRPDLRSRFPRALTDGKGGGFAEWVKAHGIELLRLPAQFSACIDAAFDADHGGRARQFLVYHPDVRSEEPLFLLPDGRAATCRRLFDAVGAELLTLEEVWWFLLAGAESPLEELCRTWAVTPLWQAAVPDGATVFGIVDLVRWVSETYGITADWLFEPFAPTGPSDADQIRLAFQARPSWQERFPDALRDATQARALLAHQTTRGSGLPFVAREWAATRDVSAVAARLPRQGVNVLGHFAYPSGLRESVESMVEGLRLNDVPLSLRDVPVRFGTDEPLRLPHTGSELFDTTIIHVQPQPLFNDVYARSGLKPRADRTYRIGYWYWEFEDLPSDWNRAAFACDEFWTATEFVAEGLRRKYRKPVRVLCPGVEIPQIGPADRAGFGLPEDRFLFLFAFHMTSVMERKNPLGLIRAFRTAFRVDDAVTLVIKTAFGQEHPEAFAELRRAAAENGVVLIDETFTRQEQLGLMAACDAYVSLHRSEGLGMSMAEAMLLGKPVIATRYSGNLAFMNDDNSLLVDTRMVSLDHELPPYGRGLRWGEPSTDHAVELMRKLYDDRVFGAALGAAARADLSETMNYRRSGSRMAARLAEIAALP